MSYTKQFDGLQRAQHLPCKAGLREFLLERVRALKTSQDIFQCDCGQGPSHETTDSDRGTIWENELSYISLNLVLLRMYAMVIMES